MIFRAKPHQPVAEALRALPLPADPIHGRLDAIVEEIAKVRERVSRLEVVILFGVPLLSAAFNWAVAHLR